MRRRKERKKKEGGTKEFKEGRKRVRIDIIYFTSTSTTNYHKGVFVYDH